MYACKCKLYCWYVHMYVHYVYTCTNIVVLPSQLTSINDVNKKNDKTNILYK